MTTTNSAAVEKEPKEPTKKPKAAVGGSSALARANAAILKHTGQKPLKQSTSTHPHVPTGSIFVDHLIGGSPTLDGKGLVCPGFPRRRIVEVYGPESSGKTTLLLSSIVQVQRLGGSAMFIDFEHALDHKYAKAIGVKFDPDSLSILQPDTMEEGLKMIYAGIATGVDLIGVDSVAAMVPKDEFEKGFDDAAKIGALAKKMAEVLPKFATWLYKMPTEGLGESKKSIAGHPGTALVFLNQTRALINTGGGGGHGDNENTAGGKALKFYAYLRLRMSRNRGEFVERKDEMTGKKRKFSYGNQTDVKVVKSKIDSRQGQTAQIFIRFGYGVDDYYSVIETGVVHKLIKKEGTYYAVGAERFQGRDKLRKYFVDNPKVFEDLRVKIVAAVMNTSFEAVSDDDLTGEDQFIDNLTDEMDELGSTSGLPAEEVIETAEAVGD